MKRIRVIVVIGVGLFVGGVCYAAVGAMWRPVMPEIEINIVNGASSYQPAKLMVVYGERGGDPFRNGRLAYDQRISSCEIKNNKCVSPHSMRHELLPQVEQVQSIQIRHFNGDGNPSIGGVVWQDLSNPREIEITCDLSLEDATEACAMSAVRYSVRKSGVSRQAASVG